MKDWTVEVNHSRVSLYLSDRAIAFAKMKAAQDKRSLSNWVNVVLDRQLEAHQDQIAEEMGLGPRKSK
jgi:hypothetical protein